MPTSTNEAVRLADSLIALHKLTVCGAPAQPTHDNWGPLVIPAASSHDGDNGTTRGLALLGLYHGPTCAAVRRSCTTPGRARTAIVRSRSSPTSGGKDRYLDPRRRWRADPPGPTSHARAFVRHTWTLSFRLAVVGSRRSRSWRSPRPLPLRTGRRIPARTFRAPISSHLSTIDGELRVPGLDSAVEVRRDRWGVPHSTRAQSTTCLFAQGYVAAQEPALADGDVAAAGRRALGRSARPVRCAA